MGLRKKFGLVDAQEAMNSVFQPNLMIIAEEADNQPLPARTSSNDEGTTAVLNYIQEFFPWMSNQFMTITPHLSKHPTILVLSNGQEEETACFSELWGIDPEQTTDLVTTLKRKQQLESSV